MEEGLIHGPRVVLGELLDFLRADWLDVLIKRVGADSVDKILNSLFDLVVLALELLRLGVDPLRLHLDEGIESVCLSLSGEVHKDSLG